MENLTGNRKILGRVKSFFIHDKYSSTEFGPVLLDFEIFEAVWRLKTLMKDNLYLLLKEKCLWIIFCASFHHLWYDPRKGTNYPFDVRSLF